MAGPFIDQFHFIVVDFLDMFERPDETRQNKTLLFKAYLLFNTPQL